MNASIKDNIWKSKCMRAKHFTRPFFFYWDFSQPSYVSFGEPEVPFYWGTFLGTQCTC